MKLFFTFLVLFTSSYAFSQTDTYIDNFTQMQFIEIKGNCSDNAAKDCIKSFFIGVHEVTQGEWRKVMKTSPSHFKKGDDYPVENITYSDATKFINTLNKKQDKMFRLPTIAEYEYIYDNETFDNISSCSFMSIYDKKSDSINQLGNKPFNCDDKFIYTAPVGTFPIDRHGLYDIFGNVSEWSVDAKGKPYTVGGSCFDGINEMKNLIRKESPTYKFGGLGLRLALDKVE